MFSTTNHMFIVCTPKNILLKKSINNSVKKFEYAFKNKQNVLEPQELCGPGCLGEEFNKLINKPPHSIIDRRKEMFCSNNKDILVLFHKTYLLKYLNPKYNNYFKDQEALNNPRYGKSIPAFSYKNCIKYLKENNIDINGKKI